MKLTKTLLALLCSDESDLLDAVLPALLRIANKMLSTSMKKIQDQFCKEFSTNKKSEKLFERMCTAINRNIFIYKWHPGIFARKKNVKMFRTIENINIQKEILVFIKLLCSNHNAQLQEFMLEQKLHKNSYNMICLLVRYLEMLVKEIMSITEKSSKEIIPSEWTVIDSKKELCYQHSILSIKALMESVQGPCKKNQEAISTSGFLVLANKIMSLQFMYKKENQKYYFTNYQICKLKNECCLLLLSLLEQRSTNDSIVIDMRQYLKEDVLLENIKFVYYTFMLETDGNYSEELLFAVLFMNHTSHSKSSPMT